MPMLRVLVVSPHFPPSNAPDMQRVRLILPYLRDQGWQAEVLAVQAGQVVAPQDPWLAAGLPPDVPVHRVVALGLAWDRIPGLGTLTFRALGALRRTGDALIEAGRFDLVYFSTTQFGVHTLGPRWQRCFGVPFTMDYQDPWVNDYYRLHPQAVPPGGRFKYAVADRLNRWMEPRVLRYCAGITSVSEEYPRQLRSRYAFLPADWLVEVLPFPGDGRDLRRVEQDGTQQSMFTPSDGPLHWVYVGRGGADMHPALRGLFGALRDHARNQPGFLDSLRLHFVGTSYAAAGAGRKTVEPIAAEYGLAAVVEEHPGRIPYSQTLRCLLDADALIVPGSDDPGYTASKIYPYLLAGKPLLAVFHEQSSVVSLMRTVGGGVCVPFQTDEPAQALSHRLVKQWLESGAWQRSVPLDRTAFAPHTAGAQAAVLCRFFERCLARIALGAGLPTSNPQNGFTAEKPRESDLDKLT